MHEVDDLFPGEACKTRVYISDKALSEFVAIGKKSAQRARNLRKKLNRCAKSGFELWTGATRPIRHEWDGVFRIGWVDDLFRFIGFYDSAEFIIIDGFEKKGRQLSRPQRAAIDEAARVRRERDWRRKVTGGHYPRLARSPA